MARGRSTLITHHRRRGPIIALKRTMAEVRGGVPYELLEGVRVVLLAAAASVLGYSAAFAYEAGLTGTLDLPVTMIAPQLPATILATASLFITATVVLLGAEIVIGARGRIKDPVSRAVARDLLPLALFGLLNVMMYQRDWQEWAWTFLPLALVALADFVVAPLALHRNKRSYRAKVLAAHHRHWSESMVVGRISQRIGPVPFGALLFVLLFLYFAYVVGRSAGLDETSYLVTNDPSPTVVVRIYGNVIITEPYNPATLQPSRRFSTRSVDSAGLVVTPRNIGHLSAGCNAIIGCHSPIGGPVGLP
jgi:hypothetical protein